MSRISSCAKDICQILKYLAIPYQFGFIEGHDYLGKHQIARLKTILGSGDAEKITNEYEDKFSNLIGEGSGISFASGRMAFFVLMKMLNIGPGHEVILPGFTCSVMPNAVWRAGATPVFVDIEKSNFGPDVKDIERKINSKTKMIVAQHSFGIPCNIEQIANLARKHGIFLLEDSAIALDSSYDNITVGNWGDAAIFSTDHSKPINTIIGGFLYAKNKPLYEKIKKNTAALPQLDKKHQERLFSQFLFEAKYYNPDNYPRALALNSAKSLIKRCGFNRYALPAFLEDDYGKEAEEFRNYPYPAKMPPFLAKLGIFELERWDERKKTRKDILKIYVEKMRESRLKKYLPEAYLNAKLDIVPLRFIFTHPDSGKIMKQMGKFVDTAWTWFLAPVECSKNGPEELGYAYGSCPVSEKICKTIVNWPCTSLGSKGDVLLNIFNKVIGTY